MKERILRFMLLVENDEELKRKYQDIVNNRDRKDLTEDLALLAKSMGFDFSSKDIWDFLEAANYMMTDEELEDVVGGRGEFTQREWWSPSTDLARTISCDFAPDDDTFVARYKARSTNCPDYVYYGYGATVRACGTCKHFNVGKWVQVNR